MIGHTATESIPATPSLADARHRTAIAHLARVESFTMLRRLSLWIGLALTLASLVVAMRGQPQSATKYRDLVPLSSFPMTFAMWIVGVRAGHRDRSSRRPSLADSAPLGGDERAMARLASLVVPICLVAFVMALFGIASRLEGGFRMGDGSARTEGAVHSIFDLLQPPLVVAVVGAAGVATGRAARWSSPPIVLGLLLLFIGLGPWWLWNERYVYATALMQVQPLEFPERQLVHAPTVALHDLYLLALVAVFSGLALRQHPRGRLVGGGALLAALAVVAQLVVAPF
ncbi:hypothetical protein [Ilumatobacter sp.]|uniref:hypothetical protein n=1 Tax=Ilumatobacter sp. TaxID=1967498 RepID=UPI003C54C587